MGLKSAKASIPKSIHFLKPWLYIDHKAAPSPAVYFLIHRGEVTYVGQSKNLHSRIRAHRSSGRITFDRVVSVQPRPEKITHLECELITRLRPEHNKNSPQPILNTEELREAVEVLINPAAMLKPWFLEYLPQDRRFGSEHQ